MEKKMEATRLYRLRGLGIMEKAMQATILSRSDIGVI